MFPGFASLLSLSLAIIWLCTGCAVTPLQERNEYPDIRAGSRAVLLLKVTDGRNLPGGHPVSKGLGGFGTGGEVQFPGRHYFKDLDAHIGFLSRDALKQGWFYFILKPGVYYLAFVPMGHYGVSQMLARQKSAQRWSIEIPDDSSLIYGGSIHLPRGLICMLKNEESLATKIASEYMPELGAPNTVLLQRHRGGPIIIERPK